MATATVAATTTRAPFGVHAVEGRALIGREHGVDRRPRLGVERFDGGATRSGVGHLADRLAAGTVRLEDLANGGLLGRVEAEDGDHAVGPVTSAVATSFVPVLALARGRVLRKGDARREERRGGEGQGEHQGSGVHGVSFGVRSRSGGLATE